MIIRSPRKERDFTILSNSVCLDSRLSMRGLGLLVRLLSRPDNWTTNSETLAREFDCGRDQVRTTLRELTQFGYMVIQKTQDDAGHWSSHWVIYDEPTPEKPTLGEPTPEKPAFGKSGALTRTDLKRTDNNNEELFNRFWTAYPSKKAKPAALKAFNRLKASEELTNQIIVDIEKQKASEQWQKNGGQFIPMPATYLNQRRWEDGIDGSAVNEFSGGI